MLLLVRALLLLLGYLACLNYARRVRTEDPDRMPSSSEANALKAIALTLAASNPSAGFSMPARTGASSRSLPIGQFARSSSIFMGGDAVTVLGGSGFVGSRVCKALVEAGADVTSVSKSGTPPKWCASEPWTGKVAWKAIDLTRGPREKMEEAIGSPAAIVSCVGAIGTDVKTLLSGNGIANSEAAKAAKKAGVKKFVYVSVASDVSDSAGWLPYYFSEGYFKGKRDAEAAIIDAVGEDNAFFVKPSFIYGGDEFGLLPPRVSSDYGSGVEELLSNGPFKFLAENAPGLIGVAFRPPVSVDTLAKACAGQALGTINEKILDGTEAINAAAGR